MNLRNKFTLIEKIVISFMVMGCLFWGIVGYVVYSYFNK